jgi:hypothetical protein
MEGIGTFKEKFESLKGTNTGRLIALGLILLINTGLLFVPLGCMIILLIPLATMGIQYLFGERSIKMMILFGLLALLLTCLILGVFLADQYANYDTPPVEGYSASGFKVLENAKVNPISGSGNQIYNFTVIYTDPGGTPDPAIRVTITSEGVQINPTLGIIGINETHLMNPVNASASSAEGKEYYFTTNLPDGVFFYNIMATNGSVILANTSVTIDGVEYSYSMGPVNIPFSSFIFLGLTNVPFLAMIYLLFILLYWWTQKAKTYQPPRPPEEKKDEDEFTCSKCGADVPGDATRCPKCGEAFEEDEEEKKEEGKKETVMASKTDAGYCRVCNRRVNKGDMMLGCQCGRAYHLRCANQVGKCPACGTEFM